jgi:predicted O-linked N-acetylglucosamine transferase (SPINDLY family)
MATPVQTVQLALEMARQGRPEAGIAQLRRFVQKQPTNVLAMAALGQLLMQTGQLEPAIFQFQRCVELAPTNPANHNNLATALNTAGRSAEAEAEFTESVRLDPKYGPGWIGLSLVRLQDQDYRPAAEMARRGVDLRPELAEGWTNLSLAYLESGLVEEAIGVMREALGSGHANAQLRSTYLISLNLRGGLTPQALRVEHEAFARAFPPTPGMAPAWTDPDPERRLRIGIVSGDFRTHSVAFFSEPLLEHLDRERFEVACFSANRIEDATTARLMRHAAAWVDFCIPDNAMANRAIRERKVDILLELGGHSAGNRLPALVDKPAPIVVTALGYPNTTGVPSIDYRLVDSLTDPPGSESHCTERLMRVDPCFLCYRPLAGAPEIARAERDDGAITFGTFNAVQKASPETLRVWAEVVRRVPGSRLLLKTGGLKHAWAREQLQERCAAAGLTQDRVEVLPPTAGQAEHLALYGRVDVALDPFPYHGTTTTCEAMWMGVPVVTLAGDRHASRVGVSLLSAVGLPGLIAKDESDYIRIAADLAGDRTRLAKLRTDLRGMMAGSVLCDGPAYARRVEAALRAAWREWCAKQRRS